MNADILRQVVSFAGALLILIAYGGYQFGWIDARNVAYNVLNCVGSAILFWIALHPFQIGFIALEGAWTVISVWAIVKHRRDRLHP